MLRQAISLLLLLPCFAFAQATSNITNNGDGTVTFEVSLPSGQDYVELFARQNGTQNIAIAIQGSELVNGDGTSSYQFTTSNFNAGDFVEYRFYHYLPNSPGMFSPGPSASTWKSAYIATTQYFQTEDGDYLVGEGDGVLTAIYEQSGLTTARPQHTGWALDRAHPEDLSTVIESGYSQASFKGLYVKPCNSNVWMNIQNTPYAYYESYVNEYQDGATYLYDIYFTWSPAYGTQPSDTYACGGEYVTINTYIGPQDVRINAQVTFAYVIEFSN